MRLSIDGEHVQSVCRIRFFLKPLGHKVHMGPDPQEGGGFMHDMCESVHERKTRGRQFSVIGFMVGYQGITNATPLSEGGGFQGSVLQRVYLGAKGM